MKGLVALAAAFAVTIAVVSEVEAAEAQIGDFTFGCTTPDGEVLKPKHGDVEGALFIDLPARRESCLATIDRMIASCRDNTIFISNTMNERYADCLPIFEDQAKACAKHFDDERDKCDAGGTGAPATDDAGKTAPADEAAPEDTYTVDPVDRTMEVVKRSNVRVGPGTDYDSLGSLDPGVGVRVTGKVRGRNWLRVDVREDGGPAFVHGSLLAEVSAAAAPEPGCAGQGKGAHCWRKVAGDAACHVWDTYYDAGRTVTWSGGCSRGLAEGRGTLAWASDRASTELKGAYVRGKRQGHWVLRRSSGSVSEGTYVDGLRHGHWVLRFADGTVGQGPYADNLAGGHWAWRYPDGLETEGRMADGQRVGNWVERYADGRCAVAEYGNGEIMQFSDC